MLNLKSSTMMKLFQIRHLSPHFVLICAGLLVCGCRTYGGYGSKKAALDQIDQANARFSDDLERQQSDLESLETVRSASVEMAGLVAQYKQAVARHKYLIRAHEALRQEVGDGASYLDLSHVLGAIVSENQAIRITYQRILTKMRGVYTPAHPTSRYEAVPPFYVRLEQHFSMPTVQQAVRANPGSGS